MHASNGSEIGALYDVEAAINCQGTEAASCHDRNDPSFDHPAGVVGFWSRRLEPCAERYRLTPVDAAAGAATTIAFDPRIASSGLFLDH